jgi:hypothetical protein
MLLNNSEKAGQQKCCSIYPYPFMLSKLSIDDFDFFDHFHLQQQLDSDPKPWNGEMSALLQR